MKSLILNLFVMTFSFSQQAPSPCEKEPNRAFDFWLGEWEVKAKDGKTVYGQSKIELVSGKCVLLENWTGASGYSGKSLNYYNPHKKKWEQKWIGADGNPIEFEGDYEPGKIHYVGKSKNPKGEVLDNKLTFTQLNKNLVRQLWEQSKDGGKTWTIAFDGYYHRKK